MFTKYRSLCLIVFLIMFCLLTSCDFGTATSSDVSSSELSQSSSARLDSDADGEPDASDAYPYNPFKKNDDWGQNVASYPLVFTASDITQTNRQGLIKDLNLAADILGKYDVEWWVVGQDIDAMLELAKQWCDRRIARAQLYYYEEEKDDLERLKAICLTETAHPHASLDWYDTQQSGNTYFTSNLNTYEGWMESYRKISLNLPSSSANAGTNRQLGFTATQSSMLFQYDDATLPEDFVNPEGHAIMVFHEYYHTTQAYNVFSNVHIQDEAGNTVRPEYGPVAFSEGSANYMSEYLVRKLSMEGLYTGPKKNKPLKLEMQERMQLLQSMYLQCPNFNIEALNYGNECDPYTFGMWATAYLIHKTDNINVFHNVLWPKINSLSYVGAFEDTFGLNYKQFNEAFKTFLALHLNQQLAIIPDINFVEEPIVSASANATNIKTDSPASESPKAFAIKLGLNQPKENPEHYYLFSENIPQDLRNQHTEIHNYLKDIIGGYDRYVHIIYELSGNNDMAIEELRRLGVMKDDRLISSIQDVHDIRSCLGGFSAFNRWDDKHHYSFCVQPNPLTDPYWENDRINMGYAHRYGVMHGWIHEYFHHYQRVHVFERAMAMAEDCCGLNNPVNAPAWWVEGAAIVFPNYFMSEYFDVLNYTIANTFNVDMDKFQMGHMNMLRQNWIRYLYTPEKQKFVNDSSFACGASEEYRDKPQCDWFIMNMFLAYYINQNVTPPTSHPSHLNYGMQVVLVDILNKMYSLGFEGALIELTGLSLQQFYDQYNAFMRSPNPIDTVPDGFFPNKPLNELVDFKRINSSLQ